MKKNTIQRREFLKYCNKNPPLFWSWRTILIQRFSGKLECSVRMEIESDVPSGDFLTEETTYPNELSKRTTCEINCQKGPPSRDGKPARRHVAHAAAARGGRPCRRQSWRHVRRRLTSPFRGGPCRHQHRRQADVADLPPPAPAAS